MRIAYILLDPGIGVFGTKGASVHVQEVIRAFRTLGHEVSVFCTRTDADVPADLDALDVTCLDVSPGSDQGRRELELVRLSGMLAGTVIDAAAESASGFDLVYERYSLFSTAGAQVSDSLGVPLVMEVNAPLLEEQERHRGLVHSRFAAQATDHSFTAATRIVCVSELVADWVRQRTPGLDAVAVVPNGVNTDRITPAAGRRSDRDRAVHIGFVGTLKPWHGTDRLIAACAGLRGSFHLDIIGHGPEAETLQALARDLNLAERVTFHGPIAPESVPTRLRELDLAVAPYPAGENYFSPLKIFEYLAAGLPIVASAVGSIPGVLEGTGTAVLVPPDDTAALACALQTLSDDAEARHRMGEHARAEALNHHSWISRCREILKPFVLESV